MGFFIGDSPSVHATMAVRRVLYSYQRGGFGEITSASTGQVAQLLNPAYAWSLFATQHLTFLRSYPNRIHIPYLAESMLAMVRSISHKGVSAFVTVKSLTEDPESCN